MPRSGRVVLAIFKREFFSYFRNPTGYVFITLFVFLGGVAAFWRQEFFLTNLCNLDQLNQVFPYLLVFLVPAITMSLWAEERKQGTEELILTLPATDRSIVLGKYLAAVGIYTVALVFSLSHVVVLAFLGNPDPGLMVATYLGYWFAGVALLPLGLLASQLTDNLTVAYILGGVLCAIPVFLWHAGALVSGKVRDVAEQLSVPGQFQDLAAGVVTPAALVYFACLAGAVLYVCIRLAGRRRWPARPGSPRMGWHVGVRGVALLASAGALTLLAAGWRLRIDATSEKIHSLSDETRRLIEQLDPKRPVFISAYLSPQVPQSYLQTRRNLISFLREFAAVGRGKIYVNVVDTVKYSPEAREARDRYGIQPQEVPIAEEGGGATEEIFMGLVFRCGTEEFVLPFLDRGLPVEYELMRSIRVVSQARRRKVGVLDTAARLFGGFDFELKRQFRDWSIVPELRKQYEVVRVSPDQDYPADLDALLVVLPNTLTQPQVDRLVSYVRQGRPVFVLLDPLPAFNLELAPAAGGAGARADLRPLLDTLGVRWDPGQIAWDSYNPHPALRQLPKEVIFVGRGSGAPMAFQEKEEITSGLQEVVLIYAGVLEPAPGREANFVPLMTTGPDSGTVRWNQLVRQTLFGPVLVRDLAREARNKVQVLAARIRPGNGHQVNAVVVADVDLMGEQFFEIRRRGVSGLQLDNVTFLLNAVDELSGDRAFIALRKRRPKHRTLEALERRTAAYEERRKQRIEEAQERAEKRLAEARARLEEAVRRIEQREDLDEQTRRIMIANLRAAEERRLEVARTNIYDQRDREIEDARIEMEASIRRIQNTVKLLAVGLPPVPAFVVLVLVSIRRLRLEQMRISAERMVRRRAA